MCPFEFFSLRSSWPLRKVGRLFLVKRLLCVRRHLYLFQSTWAPSLQAFALAEQCRLAQW